MVDGTRVAVWGSGYGGAAAAMLAAEDARNVTRCVAAIAPLADLSHHSKYLGKQYIVKILRMRHGKFLCYWIIGST